MSDIKISVVVPIYKVEEQLLRKNIENLLNQTLKEIEIVLVDDGSPDNCGKICDEYAKKDDRIIVIHQKNKGLCGARNTGVLNSSGEYLTFIDGDDFIDLDSLEKLYAEVLDEKIDIVCGCAIKEYSNKSIRYKYDSFEDNKVYRGNECKLFQEKVLDFYANISSVWGKIYKTSFLKNNNLMHNEELRQGAEGFEFLIRVFDKANSIKFINLYFYHYIYNNESISASHNEKNHQMVLKCFEEINNYINNCSNRDILINSMYKRLRFVIITTAISGYFNPSNKEPYKIAKEKYKEYLKHPLIVETLKSCNCEDLDIKRKITYFFIKFHCFDIVKLIAIIRKKEKEVR